MELKTRVQYNDIMQFQLFKSIAIPRIQCRLFSITHISKLAPYDGYSHDVKWVNHFLCLNFNKLVAHRQYREMQQSVREGRRIKKFDIFNTFTHLELDNWIEKSIFCIDEMRLFSQKKISISINYVIFCTEISLANYKYRPWRVCAGQ